MRVNKSKRSPVKKTYSKCDKSIPEKAVGLKKKISILERKSRIKATRILRTDAVYIFPWYQVERNMSNNMAGSVIIYNT
jgi:hypothetical protein